MKTAPLRFRGLVATSAALLVHFTALAQPPPPAAGRAIFFSEPNYRGESLIVESGATVENLEFVRDGRGHSFNDRISSVRFEGPVRAAVFEHAQFRGAFTWLNRDTPDLSAYSLGERTPGGWNDAVSSLQVEPVQRGAPAFVAWERRDADRAVRAAYRDILSRDPDSEGTRFYLGRLLDAGWSDGQLRDALRRSDEFRHRDFDAIIRRAYRDLLGREPDPDGIAAYKRGLGRGMTEAEVRAELGRSREAQQKVARDLVTRVYREMLKREPDPEGLANFTKAVVEKGWDERRLREAFRQSDEYRRLNGR